MKRLILAAALLLGVTVPLSAQAACADIQSVGSELSLEYNPFSPSNVERTFTLRIARLDPRATAVRFILVDPDTIGGLSRVGTGPSGYDIAWLGDTSRDVFFNGAEQPNATNGALVPFGSGPSGDVVSETFRLRLPAGSSVAAQDYYEALDVRMVCYSGDQELDSPETQTGNRVSIDLNVPPIISTYIGSEGVRRGEIAFGALDVGGGVRTGTAMVTAQSTVPYDIDVSTQWGRLQRNASDTYGLDYQMRLSGFAVEAGSSVACDRTPAPAGRGHLLQVALDQAQARRVAAGNYSDVITLTFSPRLGLSTSGNCSVN